MIHGTETSATGRDEDADGPEAGGPVAEDLPRPRVDPATHGRHRAEPESDEETDGEDVVTAEAPAPRRAPTPPAGFRPGPPPGARPSPPTGGFRPGPPSGAFRPGAFPAAPPTGGFPGPRRPGPYGPFDPPSHPGLGYAPGPRTGWDDVADDQDDDTPPAGNVPAVLSLVVAVVCILLSCRPLVFGSTAMAPDTYVAIALSVGALVLGVVGALRPVRRPAAVLGIAGAIVALLIVAVIPTLPL